MTGALLWLSGAAVGAAIGAAVAWLVARRTRRREEPVGARALPPRLPGLDLPVEPTLETFLRLLVDQAVDRVDLPCAVALREQDGGPVRIRSVSATADPRYVDVEVDLQSLAGRVVTEGLPIVESADRAVLSVAGGDRRRRPSGAVGVPLAAGPRVFGVLIAFGEPVMGGARAIGVLEPLAKAFVPFVLTALEADVAKRKAETDALTELPNRRSFERALRRACAGPAALVAIDIDHFKEVNDTYGHAAGDEALRLLGRLLLSALREGDVAARIGGEEFTVLLPGGDLRLAMEVAERLRALVESRTFRAAGAERRLTISCGVSAFPYPSAHPENLVPAADAALYEAKGAGRNCVVAARPGSPTAVPAGPRAKAVAAPGPPV